MITAIFYSGADRVTVNGLHQWDYGQQLRIEADVLPALMEVHFACAGMKEAIVRSCSASKGVATVSIPDVCLEQSLPITAWVFEINGSVGTTIKTITLNVIARARPTPSGEVPEDFSNRYTDLINAVNEQVETLKSGNVTVANAVKAQTAVRAEEATRAGSARVALQASTAGSAGWAGAVSPQLIFSDPAGVDAVAIDRPGVYYVIYKITIGGAVHGKYSSVFAIDDTKNNIRGTGHYEHIGTYDHSFLPYSVDGAIRIESRHPAIADPAILEVYRLAWFAAAEE